MEVIRPVTVLGAPAERSSRQSVVWTLTLAPTAARLDTRPSSFTFNQWLRFRGIVRVATVVAIEVIPFRTRSAVALVEVEESVVVIDSPRTVPGGTMRYRSAGCQCRPTRTCRCPDCGRGCSGDRSRCSELTTDRGSRRCHSRPRRCDAAVIRRKTGRFRNVGERAIGTVVVEGLDLLPVPQRTTVRDRSGQPSLSMSGQAGPLTMVAARTGCPDVDTLEPALTVVDG